MLCLMWLAPVRGELTGTWEQIQRSVSAKDEDFKRFIADYNALKFCDISVTDNEIVTVRNRRMWRDENDRKNNRERQSKHRSKRKCHEEITPLSTTATASTKKEKVIKEKISFEENQFKNIPADLTAKWKSIAPAISIPNEIAKAEAWVMSNPKLTKSNWSRFLTNWMVRAQDSARRENANTNNGNGQYRQNFKPSYRGGQRQPADIPQDVLADIAAINRLQAQKKTPGAGGENTG
jgi:hypothetical protein